jgi:type IV pilus assembly protein PilB
MKLPFISRKKQSPLDAEADLVKCRRTDIEQGSSCTDTQSIRGLSELYLPQESDKNNVRDITDVLLEMEKLTAEQYAQLRQQAASDTGIEELLLKTAAVNANDILMAKARLYGLEFRRIEPQAVDKQAFAKLDIDFIKSNRICPVTTDGDMLVVATSEPVNVFAIEDIKRQTQMKVRVIVCPQEDIDAVCNSLREEKIDYCFDDIISDIADVEVVQEKNEDFADLEKMAGQSPVIKFVNYLISNAINEHASDIHIEPKEKFTRIRYRIDGVLFETMQSPLKIHSAVISRIKIMSNLDISERRLPQDGKISVIVSGRAIDLRISVLPTNHGEKIVIRVLDSRSIMRSLDQLGMEQDTMELFHKQIEFPHGILLVTGPTGSGKSTTLYSALCQMDGTKLNISTVEDPVEYELDFCNQVQVNEKIGLDFASALRSLLRQDPDIMMIGEIRDNETAKIAVQAALTGHLVLSTLHTNDAASSITRLVNIGIDSYLIAASLNAILAQRLVRRICPKCREICQVTENVRKFVEKAGIKPKQLMHGKGCDYCRNSGYAGRIGIYEILVIDDIFRDMINKDASVSNMRKVFQDSGQPTLFHDGIKKVKQGLTTIDEVLRVTQMFARNGDEILVEDVR